MIKLPRVVTFRLDDATRSRICERVGPDQRVRNLSQFIREGIDLLQRRIRPWWRIDAAGAVVLTVRYGFKTIEFEKGKAGIAVPSKEKLIGVIETMIAAVRAGELDAILEQQGVARGVPKARKAA